MLQQNMHKCYRLPGAVKKGIPFAGIKAIHTIAIACIIGLTGCSHGAAPLQKHYTDTLFTVALTIANSGLPAKAIAKVDSAYHTYPFISVADKYAYFSFKFELYHFFYAPFRSLDSCLAYTDSMLQLIEQNGMTKVMAREYASAYSKKGYMHFERTNYEDASKYFTQSRLIISDLKDSLLLADYEYPMALILLRQDKFIDAAEYYKKALAEISNVPNTAYKYHQVQLWLDDLGICFLRAGMPDSALVYFKMDTSYIFKNKELYNIDPNFPYIAAAVVYGGMAQAFQRKGDYAEAENFYKKNIEINSRQGFDNNSADLNRMRLAGLYVQLKRQDTAMALLKNLQAVMPQSDDETRLLYKKTMWQYYAAFGTTQQHNEFLIDYLLFKDSVTEKTKNVQAINVHEVIKQLQKEYDVRLLQKDNEQKSSYLFIAVLFALTLFIIIALLWRNRSQAKKHIVELEELNGVVKIRNDYLQKTVGTLERAQDENTRILKVVTHDLRNPVGGMASMAEMLLHEDGFNEHQKKALTLIKTSGKQSLRMVEDILYSYVALDKDDRKPVDLTLLLQYNIEVLQISAQKKQQEIKLQSVPVIVGGNEDRLSRVFSNLITNAIKFSPANGAIKVTVSTNNNMAIVSIADEGIGIPAEIKDKLFEMANDIRRRGTAGEESFGLGLAICKQIIEAHGGKILVESEVNRGSTFYVSIPVV